MFLADSWHKELQTFFVKELLSLPYTQIMKCRLSFAFNEKKMTAYKIYWLYFKNLHRAQNITYDFKRTSDRYVGR